MIRTEEIDGRQCDIFEPMGALPPRGVLIFLHDANERRFADLPALVEQLHQFRLIGVAPLTGRQWWSDRALPGDTAPAPQRYLVESVLPFVGSQWPQLASTIGLMGIEMGGQGALRIAYKHPQQFPVVAAIAPAVDHYHLYDDDPFLMGVYADAEAVRQDSATLHVDPFRRPDHQFFCCDPRDYLWWEGADRLRMKLQSLGIPFECELEEEAGETIDDYVIAMLPRTVAFVADRMLQDKTR